MFQALKWTEDGELSSIDMARILDALNNEKLVECKTEEHEPVYVEMKIRPGALDER